MADTNALGWLCVKAETADCHGRVWQHMMSCVSAESTTASQTAMVWQHMMSCLTIDGWFGTTSDETGMKGWVWPYETSVNHTHFCSYTSNTTGFVWLPFPPLFSPLLTSLPSPSPLRPSIQPFPTHLDLRFSPFSHSSLHFPYLPFLTSNFPEFRDDWHNRISFHQQERDLRGTGTS